jgi:hypothetical protein
MEDVFELFSKGEVLHRDKVKEVCLAVERLDDREERSNLELDIFDGGSLDSLCGLPTLTTEDWGGYVTTYIFLPNGFTLELTSGPTFSNSFSYSKFIDTQRILDEIEVTKEVVEFREKSMQEYHVELLKEEAEAKGKELGLE